MSHPLLGFKRASVTEPDHAFLKLVAFLFIAFASKIDVNYYMLTSTKKSELKGWGKKTCPDLPFFCILP